MDPPQVLMDLTPWQRHNWIVNEHNDDAKGRGTVAIEGWPDLNAAVRSAQMEVGSM